MKNILIINQYGSTPDTGYGGRSFYLAKSLARNNNVTLVYGSYHHQLTISDHQKSQVIYHHNGSFSIKVTKLLKYSNSRSIFRIVNWFIFMLKLSSLSEKGTGLRPSLIIYSSPALLGYIGAYILARRLSCPLFIEVRDIWPLSIIELGGFSRRNWLVVLLKQIEKFAYKTADGVISNLYDLPRHINKTIGKSVIFHFSPNGVDTDTSKAAELKATPIPLNEILNDVNKWKGSGKTVVGYVGGLAQANSMSLFIDTASLACHSKELVFVIVGDGSEKKSLEAKILELGLTNIQMYPGVPKCDVHLVLESMDILFLANPFKEIYSYGVSPIKLPEYLESMKPIIHVTNARSLLEDAGCGEVVRTHDPQSVLSSLNKLRELPGNEKLRAGIQGKIYARSKLHYDTIGDSLNAFLDDQNL